MAAVVKIDTVTKYNEMRGVPTLHPLVSVIDLSAAKPMPVATFNFGVYAVYLKEFKCGLLRYGRGHYDYQQGTLVFVAPGQILGVEPKATPYETKGWALIFHPDLLVNTPLGKHIHAYSFFSYHVNEALHLSDKEAVIIVDCLKKIAYELEQAIDKHSRALITANIELLLQYCVRFYDRQFITRDNVNKGVLESFEQLLRDYYASNKPQQLGLPSVAYCAGELHLSPNYFGDLVKKETGKTAQEYIQHTIIDLAKERVFDAGKSVSQVAYELGFKYPQHFTRLFRQKVGVTPNEYRNMN
ncbi:AraC family transcriptional regulator [Panacibacter sp. DH6]|uniref:AraC family transcriptional regulator n=1 Tax=Panacibacter microcysteis TaxID=2793269 RepID=A0A931EB11_9BACT|nr:response regulator transcription factor [Panacibacter microcysteis]MBG9377679.1 AraC family transcriptional regulator [Panacibacter microcysteis]